MRVDKKTSNKVKLCWAKVKGARKYDVEFRRLKAPKASGEIWCGSTSWKKKTTTKKTCANVKGLFSQYSYKFRVRAKGNGEKSKYASLGTRTKFDKRQFCLEKLNCVRKFENQRTGKSLVNFKKNKQLQDFADLNAKTSIQQNMSPHQYFNEYFSSMMGGAGAENWAAWGEDAGAISSATESMYNEYFTAADKENCWNYSNGHYCNIVSSRTYAACGFYGGLMIQNFWN